MTISRPRADARVFWPLPATGFVLDQSLAITSSWSQVSFPYATTDISISVPMPSGSRFHRLRKP